jgi:GNAT superfamily N-acetyltransferase
MVAADAESEFDCGHADLNDYLHGRAWHNHTHGASRCFVVAADGRVAGYFALAAGEVVREDMPGGIRRNMPDPIPAIVLTRLAVDSEFQGHGLGAALLKDAVLRAHAAAELVAARVLLVHAIDLMARDFYLHLSFRQFGDEPLHLFRPLT